MRPIPPPPADRTQAIAEPPDLPAGPAGRAARWWERAVFYQVLPISFQDSNGDGKGDLPGFLSRIDYLRWLGVDAVWMTPFYPSPFLDLGYDIADFCNVDPMFGTLADFDRVVAELHAHGIKLIIDFVPNHTSNKHPWFVQSRASRENAKHDWYLWADANDDGGPPNNWMSRFGGSAWQWDETREQYYYHSFLLEQPDLNWGNAAVRAAMADVLRFWMRRGVDGFRVDAAAVLAKDDLLRDDPPAPNSADKPPPQRLNHVFTDDRPKAMTYLEDIRAVIDEFDHRVLAGEVQGKIDRIGHFYGSARPRLHLPLNFALLDSAWDALSLQGTIDAYFNAIPDKAWPDWPIGGHDKARIAGKLGQPQARVLAMLALTLRGTPFFFAGDELGMEPVRIPDKKVHDPFERLVPGYGLNRDAERAPMRWDAGENGGFTSGEPWLPMGDDVGARNVARLMEDPRSLLNLYRRLIALRLREPALTSGDYQPLRSRNDILMYKRVGGGSEILVALNTVHQPRKCPWQGIGSLLLSTWLDREDVMVEGPVLLRPDEGVVIKLRC
jgi:alpha-glucosidase